MDGIKQSERFAEIERLVGDYFRYHLRPVMSKTQTFLSEKQGEEMREYSTSLSGVLSMMASSAQPFSDPYQTLKLTGEWNSKTTEEYIEMCKKEIVGSPEIQHDLAYMAGQWRDTVVQEVGRERYDELSERLGGDLAYAYMDYRVEQLMIDRLVEQRMPKSSAEYILRKTAESSLLGLSQTLYRSPLAEEIEARSEAAYRPSKLETGTGRVLGASVDAITMGGMGSWAAFAKFVGVDAAVSAIASRFEPEQSQTNPVEQSISKGVFGSDRNVFEGFRQKAAAIPTKENTLTTAANEELKRKIPVIDFNFTEWMNMKVEGFPWSGIAPLKERTERYKDVPLFIAPGQEEAYLQEMVKHEKREDKRENPEKREKEKKEETEGLGDGISSQGERRGGAGVPGTDLQGMQVQGIPNNGNGWDGLLGSLGLDGLGDVTGNLGYIMAMLPDILLGMFTGKTQSLGLKDNLLPIASIVAGMFVRNPLLKMLLVGLGGANLLNKAGHEALAERRNGTPGNRYDSGRGEVRYKRYPEEQLNPRIVNPVLQGNTLIATIDRVPCTIQLSRPIADAYHEGALPLNTLANAVLAKSDQLRRIASQHYDDGQQETIVRTRGIQ